jgi:hypothetical protein
MSWLTCTETRAQLTWEPAEPLLQPSEQVWMNIGPCDESPLLPPPPPPPHPASVRDGEKEQAGRAGTKSADFMNVPERERTKASKQRREPPERKAAARDGGRQPGGSRGKKSRVERVRGRAL